MQTPAGSGREDKPLQGFKDAVLVQKLQGLPTLLSFARTPASNSSPKEAQPQVQSMQSGIPSQLGGPRGKDEMPTWLSATVTRRDVGDSWHSDAR